MPHRQLGYKKRLLSVMKEFEAKTFEREELIRLIILAIFCRHHIFLFGRPGVGKTYIARLAANMFGDGHYWEILMAHDTKVEQLMGEIKRDENGQLHRDLSNSMLDKPFPFLDEMFKGSNKVLNALLGPMLDRKYIEGGNIIDVPLVTLFGASNEFPEGEDIKPFEDRIMFRFDVKSLQDWENKKRYSNGEFDQTKHFNTKFEIDEIYEVESHAKSVTFTDQMLENYIKLQDMIVGDGIIISDRKFGPDQAVKVFKTSAYLNGRKSIDFSDILLLKDIAWHNLVDKAKLTEVLSNFFFGNTVAIEKLLDKAMDDFKREKGNYEADCGKIISYQKEYSGENQSIVFEQDIRLIKNYITAFNKAMDSINKLNTAKATALLIEEQCKNNIFHYNIKQETFSERTISTIDSLREEIIAYIDHLSLWVQTNKRVFDYNQRKAEVLSKVS